MNKDLENHHIGKRQQKRHTDYDLSAMGCFGAIVCVILAVILSTCSCSRTIIEERPVFVHDTLTVHQTRIDSVHHRDSIYVETFTRGDTVFRNKYIELWRTRVEVKHDTVSKVVEVPVEVTKTEIKEVPAKLTKRQLLLMALGKWMIATIVLAILSIVSYIYGKRK